MSGGGKKILNVAPGLVSDGHWAAEELSARGYFGV